MIPDRLPLHRRLRRAFFPVSVEREIADELRAHIELQTRRYVAEGMTEAEARVAARERFGDIEQVRAECKDIRDDMEAKMERAELWQELRTDVAFTLRTLTQPTHNHRTDTCPQCEEHGKNRKLPGCLLDFLFT